MIRSTFIAIAITFLCGTPFSPSYAQEQEQPKAQITLTSTEPIELEQHDKTKLFIISAKINGKDCRLLVDTGASHTTIDSNFWDKEFPEINKIPLQDLGDSNVTSQVHLAPVQNLDLKGIKIDNTFVAIVDLTALNTTHDNKIHGILGINHMGTLPVKFDFKNKNIKWLVKKALDEEKKEAIPYSNNSSGLYYIKAKVDDQELNFLLDSGASKSHFPNLQEFANTDKKPFEATFQDVNGKDKQTTRLHYTKPIELILSPDFSLPDQELLIGASPDEGILGIDCLQKITIILDSASKKLYVQHAK